MADSARWYVIHTYSGYENKVKQNIEKVVENRNLKEMIQDIRIPMESYIEVKDQKKIDAERKRFPSYVMIKMVLTDDTWYIVRNTRGVTGFVGTPTEPVPLSDKEVEALGVETTAAAMEVDFKVGDTVTVTTGSFEGFSGRVESIDLEAQTVEVIVTMFGRETPVSLPVTQVVTEG